MSKLTMAELRQFTGTETWFKHGVIRSITFTEGVKYVADKAGAYWLIDEIALPQRFEARVKAEEFQVWKLTLGEGHSAVLTCDDGNNRVVYRKEITFTDFPLQEIRFYFANNVILLPSEY